MWYLVETWRELRLEWCLLLRLILRGLELILNIEETGTTVTQGAIGKSLALVVDKREGGPRSPLQFRKSCKERFKVLADRAPPSELSADDQQVWTDFDAEEEM